MKEAGEERQGISRRGGGGSDFVCLSESWGFYNDLLTLVFLLVAQNGVALWGRWQRCVTVPSCQSGTNARASAETHAAVLKVCLRGVLFLTTGTLTYPIIPFADHHHC